MKLSFVKDPPAFCIGCGRPTVFGGFCSVSCESDFYGC